MKEYTYYFADGTKNTIEVEEKWYDLLKEMDEAERKQKYNYERHNYPLSQVDYEGETFADYSADPFEKMVAEIDKERIEPVYHTTFGLSNKQIRKYINSTVNLGYEIDDYIPTFISQKYHLLNKSEAIRHLHNPVDEIKLKQQHDSIYVDEILFRESICKPCNELNMKNYLYICLK